MLIYSNGGYGGKIMDIQYLLWLQELRNATGGVFDEFFNALSKFAVDIMPKGR